ncbi:MAG TPA: hypothetical protein VFG72_09850 [Marmoricola sp.]|nr:hypothetical protein [Marmoricola sp.]
MHEEATEPHSNQDEARPADRREEAVWWATWLGLASALVGLVDGVVMALKRKVATCPDGTYFPEGTTDFTCYVHPQAGLGIAIAALSVVLGILVLFSSMVARAGLQARTARSEKRAQNRPAPREPTR